MKAMILIFVILLFAAVSDLKDFLEDWRETYDQERQERLESEGWTPRSIPICDRDLFERIEDGCPETEEAS